MSFGGLRATLTILHGEFCLFAPELMYLKKGG
jgi:hypothetical protein